MMERLGQPFVLHHGLTVRQTECLPMEDMADRYKKEGHQLTVT